MKPVRRMWLTYAPHWLWVPVHNVGKAWSRFTYRTGFSRQLCREWNVHYSELLPDGHYAMHTCDRRKGHSGPHMSGPTYLWEDLCVRRASKPRRKPLPAWHGRLVWMSP